MSIQVSPSLLKGVEACPRAFHFRITKGLRGIQPGSEKMLIGQLVHSGLAFHYAGNSYERIEEIIRKEHEIYFSNMNDKSSMDDVLATVLRILDRYIHKEGKLYDETENLVPITVETPFEINLLCGASVIGVIDLVALSHVNVKKKGTMIYDHKITGSSNTTRFYGNPEGDIQVIIYLWAAKHVGLDPIAFVHNFVIHTMKSVTVQRNPTPYNPAVNDRMMDRLNYFLETLMKVKSDTIEDILRLPGNPGACRMCPFTIICDARSLKAAELAVQIGFTVSTYLDFEEIIRAKHNQKLLETQHGKNDV